MTTNRQYPPSSEWESLYNSDYLHSTEIADERDTFFCHVCDTQVGIYLSVTYEPVCDRCFGQFIERVRDPEPPATRAPSPPPVRTPSPPRPSTNNNATHRLPTSNIVVRQQSNTQSENSGLQQTQPGISFRLYENTPASSSQNTRSISPSSSPSPQSSAIQVPVLPRTRQKKTKWWNPFSKKSSALRLNDVGDTDTANGLLSSSLARLERTPRASSAVSITSYHPTGNSRGVAGTSSSAIEVSQNTLWEDDEEEPCPICADDLYTTQMQTVKLSCQHIFHRDCIRSWLERDTTCPYCRNRAYMSTAVVVTGPPP